MAISICVFIYRIYVQSTYNFNRQNMFTKLTTNLRKH